MSLNEISVFEAVGFIRFKKAVRQEKSKMKTETEQQVLEWIDWRRDYLIDFLRNLIGVPSITGEELEIQKLIARKLESMDLEVDLWEPDHEELTKHPAYLPSERGYKDRPNVVGRYRGTLKLAACQP